MEDPGLRQEMSGLLGSPPGEATASSVVVVPPNLTEARDINVGKKEGSSESTEAQPLTEDAKTNSNKLDTLIALRDETTTTNVSADQGENAGRQVNEATNLPAVVLPASAATPGADERQSFHETSTIRSLPEPQKETDENSLVERTNSQEQATKPAPTAVVRSDSDEGGKAGDQGTAVTAPPALPNYERSNSEDDDLDEFIKSPQGQNAIVERSPGGRYVRFMEKLGSGASKDVYRAYDTQEGIEVAWNVVSLSGVPKNERNRIVNEVRLLERLHHHNIISFHGSWVNRERQEVHFVTEILSSGTLKSFINKVQVIRWKIAKRWAVQILKGLEYLHSQDPPVIHRDLKCENIFINGTSGDLRIGDLGLSTAHGGGRALSVLGTPEFMAPDMYEDTSYDEKVDIYAFGMCMLEIFTKEIPYKECKNPAQIYKKVINGELPEILSRLQSRHARDFIMLCLGYKDENGKYVRPTPTELLTHEFLIKRPNDEDEVMVDPPLIKRTIAENESVSPSNSGWPSQHSQNRPQPTTPAQPVQTDNNQDKSVSAAPSIVSNEQGSVDGDESDRFDEMPDSEVNIRRVKVLMGRGQELQEDEQPMHDSSAQSVEGSTNSRAPSVDQTPDPSGQKLRNGVVGLKPGRKVSIGPSLQVTQPGHYLVAAAVIENEVAQAYPDDILKLVVTLPVEGQTQNVQFDFHLVEDDPVQVGKEMVAELGIPQGAVLEISETISGLACAARMQRDKYKLQAQQEKVQGLGVPQQQHLLASPPPAQGGNQDIGQGVAMQQQQAQLSHQQQQHQLPLPADQTQQSQASQLPTDGKSHPSPFAHLQGQHHVPPQSHLQTQSSQGGNMISDSQSQPTPFGYDMSQPAGNVPQQQQLQSQQLQSQQINVVPTETQSLPAYGYDGARAQIAPDGSSMPIQNTSLGYDPGPGQQQNQQVVPQPNAVPEAKNQQNAYHFDQMNPPMPPSNSFQTGQHANALQSQQLHVSGQTHPQQHLQQPIQRNSQPQIGNTIPSNQQLTSQVGLNQPGPAQPYGHATIPAPPQAKHHEAHTISSQQQNILPQQSQHMQIHYPSSPQQQHVTQSNGYEHGVSLPNANSQYMGYTRDEGLKRSVSTNSHQATVAQQRNTQLVGPAATSAPVLIGGESVTHSSSERRLPPSRSSSSHTTTPMETNANLLPREMSESCLPAQMLNTDSHIEEDESQEHNMGSDADVSEDDPVVSEELRKLDEDYQKNVLRTQKVYSSRMENLQRSQIEKEAQHRKNLEKHAKDKAEYEKRIQQEEKEQNRRIEQLQRDFVRKREVLAKGKRKGGEEDGTASCDVSLSSSPEQKGVLINEPVSMEQFVLNPTMSADSTTER